MKFLLTSSGLDGENISNEFVKLVGKPANQIKVVVVQMDSKYRSNSYNVNRLSNQLLNLGINKKYLKVLVLETGISYKDIISYDVLMMGDGNSFLLLDHIRKNAFDKVIKKFITANKIYVGVSSGSYITCPTIEMATWKGSNNKINLKDLTALNLIPFLITAHYDLKYKKIIDTAEKQTTYKVMRLKDRQAIIVTDKETRVIE